MSEVHSPIKFFKSEAGYGFVTPESPDGATDVFFHVKDLPPGTDVATGDILDFEIKAQADGRLRAINITVS